MAEKCGIQLWIFLNINDNWLKSREKKFKNIQGAGF
jgi:hypothetical protein